MTESMQIVCLANSRKLSGRCVAGREWSADGGTGRWIRFVSERENQEVSEYERQYEDGSDPGILDIIEVPVLSPQPEGYQTENWLLDPDYYWEKAGVYSSFDLPDLIDPVEPLWIDGYSTFHGCNDTIPLEETAKVAGSLRLIAVEELTIEVFSPGEAFGNSKRRVQGQFMHAGQDYAFWVTDPLYEMRYLAKLDGTYGIGECHLTISLGELYRNSAFKLIAAIIEPDGQ